MRKTLLFCLFFIATTFTASFAFSMGAKAEGIDTGIVNSKIDSSKIARRIINRDFNKIYTQNLAPAFFGQEFFQPHKTLLVGDINTHFVLLNSPRSRFFFDVSARVKVRLLKQYGNPVKSPSYMPSANLYYRLNDDAYHPQYLSASYTHHSNGIRGPSLEPDGRLNVDSGKFSTDFMQLNYTLGKRIDRPNTILSQFGTLGVELHRSLFSSNGGGASLGLPGNYGFVRVNGTYIYNLAKRYQDDIEPSKSDFKNWQRLQFDFTYIAGKTPYSATDLGRRLNASLKYYYQFPFMHNAAFVVGAGYRGQDDYNIYFQDHYFYMQLGIASGLNFLFSK
ncbi:hypothetical protein FPZ42_05150 [Mucilaginibacter achroorhodeus]|uniref:Phosphatidylcholine 1-acylhydrolase n=1 Tax=Mucilaginibacter achroorhodeus TaxID=2599294 RepID=A0A563UB83_9SPHI|nr:hypothetical protein [Mucilaginibacter achroorhodeus]TWR28600.1 hypothetical protein FPZ42_05150 [Mucilaginibacter achroorhodeus]